MKYINNLTYLIIGLSGFILTWIFNETTWIFPLTIVILAIWLILEYLINQRLFKKQIWIGFGKKTVFYKNLVLYSIFGGIWIFLGLLPTMNKTDILLGLDIKFYMGCFFIVTGFIDIWTYPVIMKEKSISFRSIDLSYEKIKTRDIINCSNQQDELIITTKKKKINILKVDVPIELVDFENITHKIIEHTRHNK